MEMWFDSDLLPCLPSFISRVCSGFGPCWAGCKLGRCEPVEARVRSMCVVVDPPFLDDLAGFVEVGEQVFVETLVTQAAVEACDKQS